MFGYYMLRPVREAMGIERGWEQLTRFFAYTALSMAVAVPFYFWLVSRISRRRIVPMVLRFAVVNLIAFWALLRFQIVPRATLAPIFFVWLSVFNLFAISVFWSLMADLFSREQGKRFFGMIAVGGSVGGILGPLAAGFLSKRIGQAQLLIVAAAFLEIAVDCMSQLPRAEGRERIGGSLWSGFERVMNSPYLLAIGGQTIATTVTATFLFFQQARIVQAGAVPFKTRSAMFAGVRLLGNIPAGGVSLF